MAHKEKQGSLLGNMKIPQVRLLWSDSTGQRQYRVVPAERFNRDVIDNGVALAKLAITLPPECDGPAQDSGLTIIGDIRLVPDLATKHQVPWYPEHEVVLVDMHSVPGTSWEYCPRGTLKRLLRTLKEEFELELRAGYENEFYFLKHSQEGPLGWSGVDFTLYCSAPSYERASEIMDDICTSLKLLGIEVEQMHAEGGHGQFEISLNHYPALNAADNILFLRETVKTIANKHGLEATFLPKYFANDLGSGSHIHLSLHQGEFNKLMDETSSNGMSKLGQEFLAGVLYHLPSILVFTAPHPNSYKRLCPKTSSGAYQCWGHGNREAAVRTLSQPGKNGVSNFEFKAFDGMANPHLGLAAIVAAGIDGLRKRMLLPEGIGVDPATLPEGAVRRIPSDLNEAVQAIKANEAMKSLLGENLVRAACSIRLTDIETDKRIKSEVLLDRLVDSF